MNICIYKHNPNSDVTLRILEAYERAFQRLGHQVLVISQDMENYTPNQALDFAKSFLENKPEIGICYGFAAMPEIKGQYFFRKHNIPLVLLCFENPFFGLNKGLFDEIRYFQDYYYFFVWDTYYLDLLKKDFKNCFPIRHASDIPGTIDDLSDSKKTPFDRNIAFVGNGTDFIQLRNKRKETSNPINDLIDDALDRKINAPGENIIDILEATMRVYPDSKEFASTFSSSDDYFHKGIVHSLYEEGLGRYRYELLNRLSMFHIDYYGNSNWNAQHIHFHPPVSYTDQLPNIYRSTAINLDFPPLQSVCSINNRFFDVGASGSFLLTEGRTDLTAIFDDAKAITFTSFEELVEKIKFYLENRGVRDEVARKMRDCVFQNHTYLHRATYLLDTLPI